MNGDNNLDIVASSIGVGVLPGNGDGTFQPVVTYDTVRNAASVAVADVNGDGRPDLAVLSGFGSPLVGVLLNNNGAPPTTTSLASSVNPVTVNQEVTYTATVTPQSGEAVNGIVEWVEQGNIVRGSTPLKANQAVLTQSYTGISAPIITAIYSGDLNKASGSVSNPLTESVRGSSRTVLTTSGTPSAPKQPVTFAARITSKYGAIPNGEMVRFYDGGVLIGTGAIASARAAFTTSSLGGGPHSINATYGGDATFAPSSGTVGQRVNGYPTSSVFASSLNPSIYGQSVTVYIGDANNAGSTSVAVNQVVTKATSSATLTSSPKPSTQAQAVTFTATISSPTVAAKGPVTFTAGKTVLGTAQLSGGKAKFTTSTLAVGSTKVTATYQGDSNIAGSSASVTQTVQP